MREAWLCKLESQIMKSGNETHTKLKAPVTEVLKVENLAAAASVSKPNFPPVHSLSFN